MKHLCEKCYLKKYPHFDETTEAIETRKLDCDECNERVETTLLDEPPKKS